MVAERLVFAACPICDGRDFFTVATVGHVSAETRWLALFHRRRLRSRVRDDTEALSDRADFTQDYATAICACKRCGQLLRNPRPPESRILGAYKNDEYGAERLAALHAAQHELFRKKTAWLAGFTRGGAQRGVEVGSFVGGFLAAAREVGWQITGVDPGLEVTDFCRARGLPVVRGRLEELDIPEGSLDLVAIWNTFDQLATPDQVLAAARRLLRRRGLLVVRVPNGAFYRSAERIIDRAPRPVARAVRTALAWNNLLAFPYLHGYTPETLERLMRGAGFCPVARRGDTLVRLADADTRRWAAWEERLVKLGLAAVAHVLRDAAPWLDVVFEADAPCSRGRQVAATMHAR